MPPDDMYPDEVLSALEANHVPLLWIRPTGNLAYDWLLESNAFQTAITREQAYFDEMRDQTLSLRDEFKRYGIEMAFIKAVDIAPSFPYKTGNHDILVRPEHANLARGLLRKLGHIEVRHLHERSKYLYRTFPNGKEGLSVHLHEHVGWDGNTFIEADTLWDRMVVSQMDPEILIPSPEDVVLITVAHALDEDKEVRLADLVKVRYCVATYDLDWDYMDSVASSRGWLYQFYAAIYTFNHVNRLFWDKDLLPGEILERMAPVLDIHRRSSAYLKHKICHTRIELPYKISFVYSKFLGYQKMLRDPALTWKERLHQTAEFTLRGIARKLKLRTQPSMLICFCGIDGSGKTRHAQALQEAFTICEVKAKYVWMRGSTSRWLNPLKRVGEIILGKHCIAVSRGGKGDVQKTERIRNVNSLWVRVIYRWIIFLELLLFYLKEVTVPLLLGWVVICDRYVVDHLVDWMDLLDDPVAYKSLPARLLRLMAPKPAVAIHLEIPVQVVLARRADELSQQSVERRIAALHTLAQRYGLVRVDASRPFEEISEELIHSILTKYLDNHQTLINAILRYNMPLGPSGTIVDSNVRTAGGKDS